MIGWNFFPTQEPRYRQIYEGALPDTLVWRSQLGYVEELTTNYLRHPAYAEYPVVGIWLPSCSVCRMEN